VVDASRARRELVEAGVATHEARWLLEEYADDPAALAAAVERRLSGEPLQYVLGHWPFRTLDLVVDSRALIPRPETEWLVDVAWAQVRDRPALRVLDLGCGTGAIGLALADEARRSGVALWLVAADRSRDALALCALNAARVGLTPTLVRSVWFDDLDPAWRGSFDLVVTNPPYVSRTQWSTRAAELSYEPVEALVAADTPDAEGFADVAAIIASTRAWLAPDGVLVAEHGEDQGEAATRAARDAGFTQVSDNDDLAHRPRVLVARA
jgi:release factor glutamine methyltransferase